MTGIAQASCPKGFTQSQCDADKMPAFGAGVNIDRDEIARRCAHWLQKIQNAPDQRARHYYEIYHASCQQAVLEEQFSAGGWTMGQPYNGQGN